VLDFRLSFLLYTLSRHRVDVELYRVHDPISGPRALTSILPSVIHIVQTWLLGVHDGQVWKCSYKFHLGTGVVNLFDMFREIRGNSEYDAIRTQYSLLQLCSDVLQEVAKRREHDSVLQIPEFGLIMLEQLWTDSQA
jgi:hypothetical protein